ncbi:acyltransferase family protein [Modestobacter versicolor]|uniref:acyltransferase family protein n=1 Tax=Modestobacter versicolor TaxID=429133 RepID=UPI0034DF045A
MIVAESNGTRVTTTSARLDSLTALRFFAAFAVVLYHSWWAFTGNPDIGLLHYGYTAVGFFFTLSGLVLAWSWKPITGTVTHLRRRAARILPLHWLMLAAMVGIYLMWPVVRPLTDTKGALLREALLLQAWPPFDALLTFNYPSWSLSTEAFCYLLFPFLMIGLVRLSARRLVWLAAALGAGYVAAACALHLLAVPTLSDGAMLALPPLQFLKFAAGVALGAALRAGWRPRVPLWTAFLTLTVVVLCLPAATSADVAFAAAFRGGPLFADLLLVGPMMLLVVAAAGSDLGCWSRTGRPGLLGRSRVLVTLGEWSFAMYLVHAPLLYLMYAYRMTHPGVPVLGYPGLAAYLVACVAAAGVLHVFFEKPVERWVRNREPARRRAAAATPAVPATTPVHPTHVTALLPAPRTPSTPTATLPPATPRPAPATASRAVPVIPRQEPATAPMAAAGPASR